MGGETLPFADALPPASANLLAPVLDWCKAHPCQDGNIDHCAQTPWIRHDDEGRPWLERGDAPDVVQVTAQLLDAADPDRLTFDPGTGVLTLHVLPAPLRYRVLYPAPTRWAVTCRLLADRRSPPSQQQMAT